MDKKTIREVIISFVTFIAYSALVFAIPFKRNAVFAFMYIFALISFGVFEAGYKIAFDKAKTLKAKFLSFPIFRVGCFYLAAQLTVSTLFMVLTSFIDIYAWIAIAPCILLLAAAIVKILTIDMAKEKIENIAIKEETETSFMRTLRFDLETLSEKVSAPSLKLKISKLSEAAKYSDPVSNDLIAEIETKMTAMLNDIKSAIYAGNNDVGPLVGELGDLLSERNRKCKISKPQGKLQNSK
ncbi:MAG: hypothetical protein FWG34_13350 [Oscillospiraceae bacterium]|nr:hypothetical protein [Oscillospiraceae bacterium]